MDKQMADIDIDPFGEHGPFGPGVMEQPHEMGD